MIKAAVLTLSDRVFNKSAQDLSGKIILEKLKAGDYEIMVYEILPDDKKLIEDKLIKYVDELKVDVVLTTGGTGFGSRDFTPEATRSILEKEIPGIPELIRGEGFKKTKKAVLSRATSGIRKKTLIINLPGSPKGIEESLDVIMDLIPHSIEMINDKGHDKIK